MIIKSNKVLLFIEPKNNKSEKPVIDDLTIKMFLILKRNVDNVGTVMHKGYFAPGIGTMGLHECVCGATSHSCDYLLDGIIATNWLCVHYLAYHRDEIPKEEIEKLNQLKNNDVMTENDLPLLEKCMLRI